MSQAMPRTVSTSHQRREYGPALSSGSAASAISTSRLSFAPRLPRAWSELEFSLRFCDRQIRVALTHDEERYLLDEGDPLQVIIRREPHLLAPGAPLVINRLSSLEPRLAADLTAKLQADSPEVKLR